MSKFVMSGKYGNAIIYANDIDASAKQQIYDILNSEVAGGADICIMPDAHAGAGCVIGTTMYIRDKVVPNFVGVDIGCGMYVLQLKDKDIDLDKLDKVIRDNVPSGFNVRTFPHPYAGKTNIRALRCKDKIDMKRAELSIGSLGGGNHFIEINRDDLGNLYLVIHSGSRNLGKQIAQHYQNIAISSMSNTDTAKKEMIAKMKAEGREKDIAKEISKIKPAPFNKQLAYCAGQDFSDYIYDMVIAQNYASLNRQAIAEVISNYMGWEFAFNFETVHNYIDTDDGILRKGAVYAGRDVILIIPMNMRDGSLICVGKGNREWNYSAPHGAGRVMSRKEAKRTISLEAFEKSMDGVYSTCVCRDTIDESPMAYKPMQEIIDAIGDTVNVSTIIKPIYNYKGGKE